MARNKSKAKETLLGPRRCSPNNPNGRLIGSNLRRSARLSAAIKEKLEDSKNGNYRKIIESDSISFNDDLRKRVLLEIEKDGLGNGVLGDVVEGVSRCGGLRNGSEGGEGNGDFGVNRGDNWCEDVGGGGCIGKRVSRGGGLRNGSECVEKNGIFECNRGDNGCEDVDGTGCKIEKLGGVEESRYIKRVSRGGGLRNGSECGEKNWIFECNRGGNGYEDVGGGRCKDEKLGGVEEFGYIGKRVTRRGGLRNGCGEENGSFECNQGDNGCEGVCGRGCKIQKLGGVEELGYIDKRVTRSVFRNSSDCKRKCSGDCKVEGNRLICEICEGGRFEDETSKRIVRESRTPTKRVTRSVFRNRNERERNCSVDGKAEGNCSLSEIVEGGRVKDNKSKRVVRESTMVTKRVTRSASLKSGSEYEGRNGNVVCNAQDNGSLSKHFSGGSFRDGQSKRVVKESTLISKRVNRSGSHINESEYGEIKGDADCNARNENEENVKKQLARKRKKTEQKGAYGCINGWTKEQEVALQKAYFAVKPTPHFWKEVSKMVPGKSAQDCFDRIHSDQKTPQTKKQSRAKRATPSALSFSASKLLSSRRSKFSKRNRHLGQKTVRQLLQKQVRVNKDGADLFAVLEKSIDPIKGPSQHCTPCSTPKLTKRLNLLNVCQGTSSSAHKKQLSRFSNSSGSSFTSPPVLKQIKNIALHEKYIDQLHCREAKRRASVDRLAKKVKSKRDENRFHGGNDGVVRAATNALLLDATDAINQFQQLQMSAVDSLALSNDEITCSDDDESEHGL